MEQRLATGVLGAYRGAEEGATRGCAERLGLQRWPEGLEA